jgi:osmotically-inducible protein OsmY
MRSFTIAAALTLAMGAISPALGGDDPGHKAGDYPADNTGRNVRDRDGGTLTSGDQSNDPEDLAITQQVRQALVADKSLSTNAHNVKVITTGGIVTLRGPVDNAAEKAKVSAAAERVAGVKRVDNQLEVASQ